MNQVNNFIFWKIPNAIFDFFCPQQTCAKDALSSEGLYAKGCFELVVEQIEDHEGIIGWVAIGILVAMVSTLPVPEL